MKPITHHDRHIRTPKLHHRRRINDDHTTLLPLRIHRHGQQDSIVFRHWARRRYKDRLRWQVIRAWVPDQRLPTVRIDLDDRVGEVPWLRRVNAIRILIGLHGVFLVDLGQLDVAGCVVELESLDGFLGDQGAVRSLAPAPWFGRM